MKNRKRIIVAFMLVAVMLLGIGYAALTDDLFITGDATLNTTQSQDQFDRDVKFIAATVKSSTGTYISDGVNEIKDEATVATDDSARFNVKTLAERGEKVTFLFTVQNSSIEFDAVITPDADPSTNNTEYFSITYDMDANVDGVQTEGTAVKNGGTSVIAITVELLKSPEQNTTATFNFDITATSK
ncbi:MAG: hypothetical protein E7603_08790 [Ruminococcaceae bacterium]|nr:hypothetical protein [Oscillospiraceae bacterium]